MQLVKYYRSPTSNGYALATAKTLKADEIVDYTTRYGKSIELTICNLIEANGDGTNYYSYTKGNKMSIIKIMLLCVNGFLALCVFVSCLESEKKTKHANIMSKAVSKYHQNLVEACVKEPDGNHVADCQYIINNGIELPYKRLYINYSSQYTN